MDKKEMMFMLTVNIILMLINIIWAMIDINTYIFIGITIALLPTILYTINVFKAYKEI